MRTLCDLGVGVGKLSLKNFEKIVKKKKFFKIQDRFLICFGNYLCHCD